MRTTVAIDDRLLAAAKATARESGQTLGEFVEESLRLRLAKRSATTGPRIPVFTQGTGLRPGVDASSNRSLFDALDEAGDLA
jgi:hypothetical protein